MDRDYELQTHRAEDRHWWYRGRRSVLERVTRRLCACRADARILDAGCGSGRNMVEFARHGTVTGIELSRRACASRASANAGEVVEGSVLDMPFAARAFDLARVAGRDRAPRGRPARAARAAPRGRAGRHAADHGARLPVAVERARRDQPPPPPLHAPLPAARSASRPAGSRCARRTSTRCCCPAAILLRVLDRFSRKTDRVEPRPVGAPGAAELAARAPAATRGGADRPRRADPRGAVAARRVSLSARSLGPVRPRARGAGRARRLRRRRRRRRRARACGTSRRGWRRNVSDGDDGRRAGLRDQLVEARPPRRTGTPVRGS